MRISILFRMVDVIHREYNYVNRVRKREGICNRKDSLMQSGSLQHEFENTFPQNETSLHGDCKLLPMTSKAIIEKISDLLELATNHWTMISIFGLVSLLRKGRDSPRCAYC